MNTKFAFWVILVVLLYASAEAGLCQVHSVLRTGAWFKIPVSQNGVYKISYDYLKALGVDPSTVDPRKIRIFGNGGGMLPQPNATPRPSDLNEVSIFISGESDGKFDKSDFILFYGEGPSTVSFNTERNEFEYQNNIFADNNYYFLNTGEAAGKRIGTGTDLEGTFPVVNSFDDYIIHEKDLYNVLKSGREWFGEKFDLTTNQTFSYDLPGVIPHSGIHLVSSVMAQSFSGSSFQVTLNNVPVDDQSVPPVANSQYAEKGVERTDTTEVNDDAVQLSSTGKLQVGYTFTKVGSEHAVGYLNYFLIHFERKLALYNDQTSFRSTGSINQSTTTYQMDAPVDEVTIWNITDPGQPVIQPYIHSGTTLSFSVNAVTLQEFIVFDNRFLEPGKGFPIANQDLHGLSTPNMIIVTNATLLPQARALADHREKKNNWIVDVVTTDQVYNEFSSGRQDVTAIRDFVKMLYDRDPVELHALLLFGKGSYDYKGHILNNADFVPIYESYNSLHPLLSYASDDYYTFLESSEGQWNEDPPQSQTMDISVGRIPAKTNEEAQHVVDKIVAYDDTPSELGVWRNHLAFVADDGDGNIHQSQSNQLAEHVESTHPAFETEKIFLDAYPQKDSPSGQVSPETHEAIVNAFDNGSLIINYTGHGSEQLWAQERIFDDATLSEIQNHHYPLMVTATCEFGRQDDPQFSSNGENLLLKENAGAIGLVSTSRLVQSGTNFNLNQAFYDALLNLGPNVTVGDLFRQTKNASESGVSNRNFSLLCDPSLTLAMPQLKIDSIQLSTASKSDTLKALSSVTVTGNILNSSGKVQTNFIGVIHLILFDKREARTTLGDENPPFSYQEWDNRLFSGKASVTNGAFTANFMLPKNIRYSIGNGKLVAYADDTTSGRDAAGSTENFRIGASEKNVPTESDPPSIRLYIGDTTFVNGGYANTETQLIGKFYDAHGISISDYGIGNGLSANLDDSIYYNLNDYYESSLDDFTQGAVTYPLHDLAPGKHHIEVKAWDLFNNPTSAQVNFIVKEGSQLNIERFACSPNPFRDHTSLFFTHNRSGDDLSASLVIYNDHGALMRFTQLDIDQAPYWVDLLDFNSVDDYGKNLGAGLYLARLIVRSKKDGSTAQAVTKLIITN